MERRDPRFSVVVLQAIVDPARDLACGAGRKREDEDLVATGDPLAHRLLVKVDQSVGLACARSGEHTNRSYYFMDVEWQQVSQGWRRAT